MTADESLARSAVPGSPSSDLAGRVAIVTGARGGIGRAVTAHLIAGGASVLATDLGSGETPTVGGDASSDRETFVPADISEATDVDRVIAAALDLHGRIDLLVNVAAVTGSGLDEDLDVVEMTLESWDRVIAVNLRGTMLMCRQAIPHMLTSGGGAIVNVSSKAAVSGSPRFCAYSASKAGVNSLTMTIATAFGRRGIRCNAIMPGLITGTGAISHAAMDDRYLDAARRRVSVGRLGTPDDIAALTLFLLSDTAAGYLNGQLISCDGGQN